MFFALCNYILIYQINKNEKFGLKPGRYSGSVVHLIYNIITFHLTKKNKYNFYTDFNRFVEPVVPLMSIY